MKVAVDEKIVRLKGREQYVGAYRGELLMDWELEYKNGRVFEKFAIQCPNKRCRQWWGWTFFIDKAQSLLRKMRKIKGCPACRKKS